MGHSDHGQGIPLVLIHGFPHDRSLWRPQLRDLQSVARVLAPDLRGFGDADAATEIMHMEQHASDLKTWLDRLGVHQVVLCGLSMGGYVALAFMAAYPEEVKALILCNTRAGADSEQARSGRAVTAERVMKEGVPALAAELLPKMLTDASQKKRPDLASSVEAMMARQPAAGVVAALHGMAARPDRTSMLAGITIPTLVITGSADQLIPVSESVAMAQAIPQGRLVVIPEVAHLSNVEDPATFNTAVRVFLSELA